MADIRLLLVDDDPDDCFIFTQLQDKIPNVKISCVRYSKNLFEFLNTSRPFDMIFLDLNMPILNGLECLKRIKIDQRLKSIPVIVYSTTNRQDIIEQCFQFGADEFITKPNTIPKLVATVEKVIERFVRTDESRNELS